MSRIDELLADLCPRGIEIAILGDVCRVRTGAAVSRVTIGQSPGPYPVINSGREPLGYINSYNTEDDPIGITSRGAGVGSVTWRAGRYFRGNLNYSATILDRSRIDTRFLYHSLLFLQPRIQQLCTYQGIPALNKVNLEKLTVPVPPLEVQREIVRVLDTFAALEADLEAELEARRRQYAQYREALLTFSLGERVARVTISEVCIKISSGGTPSTTRSDFYGGGIPWLRTQEVDFGVIDSTGMTITEAGLRGSAAKWIPENCVIVAMYGATAAKVAINGIPMTTNQACCNLQVDPERANFRFVFHWMSNEYLRLKGLGEGSQSNLNAQKIKDYPIVVPPLEEQNRIVEILDKFDALVNDLSIGLPAELAARRKQYEHYRDRLLTFPEAS